MTFASVAMAIERHRCRTLLGGLFGYAIYSGMTRLWADWPFHYLLNLVFAGVCVGAGCHYIQLCEADSELERFRNSELQAHTLGLPEEVETWTPSVSSEEDAVAGASI